MKFVGITKRWFSNVASIVFIILIAVAIAAFMIAKGYYYGAAAIAVDVMDPKEMASTFAMYGASKSGFEVAARDYVEGFTNKDTVAVWVINNKGKVIVSSSGFSISDDVNMPDYISAVEGGTGSASWTGRLPSGEKIMARTTAYNYVNGDFGGAIRYMVSLDGIDEQLGIFAALIAVVTILCFVALILSGMLFVHSIVVPVKEIGETAKKIAEGDFSATIDHYPYNDEIGELCTTINDMAEKLSESDRLKNDFITTVSHELRTPLTAIRGWGETLVQVAGTDPGMTKRGMEIIITESSRLNEMVEELLDFSKMNSGRMKLNVEKMDYLAELDDVVLSYRERATKNGIEISYNVPTVPAAGEGDSARIKQVFINILDNAIKYNEEGGKISINATLSDNNILTIVFADTGSGISEEDLPHVKEKFYKANSTVRGSGIGLAVCDEIIKLHKGTFEIDSVYGKGTAVTITFSLDSSVENAKEDLGDE